MERDGFRSQRWRYRWDAHDRLVGVTTLEGEEWLSATTPLAVLCPKSAALPRRTATEPPCAGQVLWGGDGVPRQTKSTSDATNTNHDFPLVGMAYLWDGDHMVAEAPLYMNGQIAWDQATHWHFEDVSHRLLAKQLPSGEMLAIALAATPIPCPGVTRRRNRDLVAQLAMSAAMLTIG